MGYRYSGGDNSHNSQRGYNNRYDRFGGGYRSNDGRDGQYYDQYQRDNYHPKRRNHGSSGQIAYADTRMSGANRGGTALPNESVSKNAADERATVNDKLRLRQEKWKKKKEAQLLQGQGNTNLEIIKNNHNNQSQRGPESSLDKNITNSVQETKPLNNQQVKGNDSVVETEEEKKKRLRREKLEAWKKKREAEKTKEPSVELQPLAPSQPPLKKQKLVTKTKGLKGFRAKKIAIKSAFGIDEDENSAGITPQRKFEAVAKPVQEPFESPKLAFSPKKSKSGLVGQLLEPHSASPKSEEGFADDDVDPLDQFLANMQDDEKKNGVNNTKSPEVLVDEEMNNENNLMSDSDDQRENVQDIVKKIESSKKLQQKKIAKINHDEIDYESFRKCFYVESEEISSLTKEEVEVLRLELDGIKVHGTKPPNPVLTWSRFGLPASYLNVLVNTLQFEKPTPIQSQSIPAILQGRDIIGIAKTGSGKSLSFILPLFRHIKDRKNPKIKDPLALILVPTRELAMQTFNVANRLDSSLKTVPVFGGENISKQINSITAGVDLVIATPGRLIDLLSLKKLKLRHVTFLVIDEADRMFDMGFQPQISMVIDNIRPDCQKVLFSATFPLKLEKLARKILNADPLEIKIGLKGVNDDVKQIIEVFDKDDEKFLKLLEILGSFFNNGKIFEDIRNSSDVIGEDKVLIFVDRQESADILGKRLTTRGYQCESLHGGKSQVERDTIINNFKKNRNKILIATSIAARGLDVPQLKLVINYDCPNHIEDYVHRAGRTGRAGSKGKAISFLMKEQERAAYDIVKALRLSKADVPAELVEISNKFLAKIKSGKERVFAGFGGKGLEKLEAKRDESKKLLKQKFATEEDSGDTESNDNKGDDKAIGDKLTKLSDFEVHEGKAVNSPDSGAFHAKINVNDLPQAVRWRVTNRETMAKIIEDSACAITSKGQFYKNPDQVLKSTDEPKLYLLVEGDTHYQVSAAVNMIKGYIIEGMKTHMADEAKKPTTGRYNVT